MTPPLRPSKEVAVYPELGVYSYAGMMTQFNPTLTRVLLCQQLGSLLYLVCLDTVIVFNIHTSSIELELDQRVNIVDACIFQSKVVLLTQTHLVFMGIYDAPELQPIGNYE